VDLVGLLVRDHREIGVDVLPGAAGGLDAILGLVEPENSIPVEFGMISRIVSAGTVRKGTTA